jgi:hypothetical protein
VGLSADPGRAAQLGVKVSSTTIATMLRRYGLGPAPRHGPTWREFIRQQAAGILACDFLTVEAITLKTLYVLVWIELGTRRVHLGGVTSNPDSAWVTQQARNLAMALQEEVPSPKFLIHDRDTEFTASFEEVFRSAGTRIVSTPIRAPNAVPPGLARAALVIIGPSNGTLRTRRVGESNRLVRIPVAPCYPATVEFFIATGARPSDATA